MAKKPFDFLQRYDCLLQDEFITLRGISRLNQYRVGDEVEIHYRGIYKGKGTIEVMARKLITDIPMKTMDHIFGYGDRRIKSVIDFLTEINACRQFNKVESKHEYVSLFHLKKIKNEV